MSPCRSTGLAVFTRAAAGIIFYLVKPSKDHHRSCSEYAHGTFLYEAHGNPEREDLVLSPRLLQDSKL